MHLAWKMYGDYLDTSQGLEILRVKHFEGLRSSSICNTNVSEENQKKC